MRKFGKIIEHYVYVPFCYIYNKFKDIDINYIYVYFNIRIKLFFMTYMN